MQMTFNGFFPPNFMLHIETPHEDNHQHAPFLPGNIPADLRGEENCLKFSIPRHCIGSNSTGSIGAGVGGKRSMSFPGIEACREANMDDDLSDDSSAVGEKKRRLSVEQVKTLERTFELASKLEPERKMQLARALGLKPRQIAIWFQNRRARSKTKQLEKDFDALKREFEAIRLEKEALQAHNKMLQAEILALKGSETSEPINLNKEIEASCSNRSENTSEINLDIPRATTIDHCPLDPHQGIPFFPSYRPPTVPQVIENALRLEVIRSPKIEHGVQDESFSDMFRSIDDQSAFWTWSQN